MDGGSVPQTRQRAQEDAAASKGSSPMMSLASPAQRPSEKLLVLHDPFHEPLDLVLSASLFPSSAVGKVAELRQKRAPNVSLHALMDELGHEQGEEAPAVGLLTVQAVRQLPGNAAASVAKGVAAVLGFASRMAVEVHLVEDHVGREMAALSSVVLLFKGQYIGRADMYHVKRSLVGECIQRSKQVLYGSISAEVQALHRDGESRTSGLVTEDTRFVFRSRSGKIFIFVQLSKEMWEFADDSNIYFELAANHFLKELFQRWKEYHTNHSVTIIFFSRCFYPPLVADPFGGPAANLGLPSSTMHVDSKGRQYRDFFKIILDNETKKDWLPVLSLLKKEFRNYPEHIGWCSPEQTPHSELPEQSKQPALAVNSSASEGNMLEAINLALNEFDKHYIDRDLTHTGQNILLISAGSGFFEVPASLAAITKQRMLDNSIGCDMVCIRKPPLHLVPLFRYIDYAKKAPDSRKAVDGRLSSATVANGSTSGPQGPGKAKETVYKIPYWIYISFYSRTSRPRQDQSITYAVPSEIVEYMEDAREPSFVTPHHAWAACNSYLMTKFLPTVAVADPRSPRRGTPGRRQPSSPDPSEHALRSPSTPSRLATTPTDSYACPSPPTASRAGSKTSPLMMMSSLTDKAGRFGGSSGEARDMAYSVEDYERLANSLSQSYHEGTPLFANDLARTIATGKTSHTRKRGAALWPTDMAILAQSTSSSRRWSHLFPKPLGKLTPSARNATAPNLFTADANWESLTAPACLPLETDFFPTERELASGFMKGAYTLSLLPGEDVYQNNTEEMIQELVSQRLAQNYQIAVTQDQRQQGVHCLALGQVFHKLVSDGQANVTVKRYYHKEKVYDIPGLHYDYALWAINDNSFRKASVEIKYDNITRFNWNYVDQMICGEATDYFDAMRGWSIHFAVIPDKGGQSGRPVDEAVDEVTREELERERIAAFLRFTQSLLRSNRIFKREYRLEVRVVSDVSEASLSGGTKSPRGGDSATLTSGSEQEGEEDDTLQSIAQRMRALDSGLEIVDRKLLLRKQRRCFVGSEAVDWVLRNVELSGEYSRASATAVMQGMMDEGYVTHTSKQQERFVDGKEFYRFIVDQNVVDIRRVALRERRQQGKKSSSAVLPQVSPDEAAKSEASMRWSTEAEPAANLSRHGSLPALSSSKAVPKLPGLYSTADLTVWGKQQESPFSSNKRNTMKVEVEDPAKQTDRYQWILLQYDEAFHPWCCFHIDIKWMMCTGSAVKEIVSHMQRQARQAGVTIIQVPSDRDLNRHPFRAPVHIQLPASLGVDRHMLLTRIKFIPFLHDGSQVVYMHRTGVAFLDVTDDGLTWSYNYTPVLQPLMADARALLQQLEDLCADLRADAEAHDSSSDEEVAAHE